MNRLLPYFARLGQPLPLLTKVCRMPVAGRWVTALHRAFAYDDVPRCRLCPKCTAIGGECMLLVTGLVSDDEAPLYRIGTDPQRDA